MERGGQSIDTVTPRETSFDDDDGDGDTDPDATLSPSPRLPPVTTATFPSKLKMFAKSWSSTSVCALPILLMATRSCDGISWFVVGDEGEEEAEGCGCVFKTMSARKLRSHKIYVWRFSKV